MTHFITHISTDIKYIQRVRGGAGDGRRSNDGGQAGDTERIPEHTRLHTWTRRTDEMDAEKLAIKNS